MAHNNTCHAMLRALACIRLILLTLRTTRNLEDKWLRPDQHCAKEVQSENARPARVPGLWICVCEVKAIESAIHDIEDGDDCAGLVRSGVRQRALLCQR